MQARMGVGAALEHKGNGIGGPIVIHNHSGGHFPAMEEPELLVEDLRSS
jgi:hypothetical protein